MRPSFLAFLSPVSILISDLTPTVFKTIFTNVYRFGDLFLLKCLIKHLVYFCNERDL